MEDLLWETSCAGCGSVLYAGRMWSWGRGEPLGAMLASTTTMLLSGIIARVSLSCLGACWVEGQAWSSLQVRINNSEGHDQGSS